MQPGPIALGWLVAGALLLTEHVVMWDEPWRLKAPWSYLLGVLTLAVGWIVWGLNAGPTTPIDAVGNIGAVSTAGAIVLACYWARGRWERKQEQNKTIQEARQLTQQVIDQGGATHARKSNLHDPSRNN